MKKRVITALGAIVLCIAAFSAWRIATRSSDADATVVAAQAAVPVVTEKVRVSDFPIVKTGIGTVYAYNAVAVHTQVTGTIQKIGFIEGQGVHPGSLIAQLDPRPFQAALEQAKANLARDQANLENAKTNLGRYTPLEKNGFATPQQVGDQSASVAELTAAVTGDKAAIDSAQTQLSYTTITSPIDGVTGIRRVDIGNIVQPNDTTPIVTITQIQPISVVFTLPQTDVPAVQAAMAKGPLAATAYSQDGTHELGTGTLLLVNNMVNPSSGTVELKATFPNENRALWPGEFVSVRLRIETVHDAVSVPLSALQLGQNGSLIFVVGRDDTVALRPITVRETLDGRALVSEGLKPDDTIVVAGQYRLSDGTKIEAVAPGDPHVQNLSPATQGMLE